MKLVQWIFLLGAVAGIAVLVLLARHKQRVLAVGLPPRIVCVDRLAALEQSGAGAIPVLGTGSMSPFIPPAPAGTDPMQTITAFAVIDSAASFADVRTGALCIYAPDWSRGRVMHQAASHDSAGWIMSGSHNAHSEAAWRVTPQNFVGIVARVYVWPQ